MHHLLRSAAALPIEALHEEEAGQEETEEDRVVIEVDPLLEVVSLLMAAIADARAKTIENGAHKGRRGIGAPSPGVSREYLKSLRWIS